MRFMTVRLARDRCTHSTEKLVSVNTKFYCVIVVPLAIFLCVWNSELKWLTAMQSMYWMGTNSQQFSFCRPSPSPDFRFFHLWLSSVLCRNNTVSKVNTFPIHMAPLWQRRSPFPQPSARHRLTLAVPDHGYGVRTNACYSMPSFHWYSVRLSTKGRLGWVDLSGLFTCR